LGAALTGPVPVDGQSLAFGEPITLMAAFGLYINVILTLFNLLPIPRWTAGGCC